jgi:hypothetical protein
MPQPTDFDLYDAPKGQATLTGVSGTPEWSRLSSWFRRAVTLHVERPMLLLDALTLSHARDVYFGDPQKEYEAMIANEDVQTILKLLGERTNVIGVRKS